MVLVALVVVVVVVVVQHQVQQWLVVLQQIILDQHNKATLVALVLQVNQDREMVVEEVVLAMLDKIAHLANPPHQEEEE
tara:strand:- start:1265 stop:1501 length:237 start_codon:yes stop_codon:yes gene_type:complete